MTHDDEEYFREIINDIFTKVSKGQIVSIDLYRENRGKVISDMEQEVYTKIPLRNNSTVPSDGKLILHIEVKEAQTEREITGIARVNVSNGIIERPDHVETTEIDTLPKEASGGKKIVSEVSISNSKEFVLKSVQTIVSIFNTLLNSGIFKL